LVDCRPGFVNTVALFDVDLDSGGGEGSTATGTSSNTNSSAPSVAGTRSSGGKRKSPVWADFDEIFEDVNGTSICTKVVCKCVRLLCLLDLLLVLGT
jgi:hypothetical protein